SAISLNMQAPGDALSVKCGACNKYLSYFPIYIAQDKQPICGRCSQLLTEENTYIRDTPYESLAKCLKFPCIYHAEGCVENLFPADVPTHELDCPFRIVACPLDCMWQGIVKELLQHFEELHSSAIMRNGEFEMDVLNSYEIYSLVIYEDELFSFKRKFDLSKNILECSLFCYKAIDPLECPVCFDYITPPIYQCVTGHSICSECKGQVAECPTCKEEIKNTQNFTLEKMAYFLTYPCRFTEYGCDFASKPGKIKQHQKYCLHGPHYCPLREYENCNWKDSVKNIYSHVLNAHHDNVLEIDTVSLFIDGNYFTTEDSVCYIMKFSDALFKLHYLYRHRTFYWAMQLIGAPEESAQYRFEIDVIDTTNNNQRMFLRRPCAPLTDKDHSFEETDYYVVIQMEQIKSFITDIFTYRVRVMK
ncbi:Sina domain containing protein, partial [Asbolus verrucosus]